MSHLRRTTTSAGARAGGAGRRAAALACGLATALGLLLHAAYYADDGFIDDAFISFRYAERWAASGELAYNGGEPTEGYSNPLWTALLALAAACGVPAFAAARVLGVGFALLAAAATWRAWEGEARRARLGPAGALAGHAVLAGAWVTSSIVGYYASSGMETTQFAWVLFAATWAVFRAPARGVAAPSAAGVLVLALLLSRPEAFGYLPCVAIAAAWRGRALPPAARRRLALALCVALLLFGAYLGWRRGTYGGWLPLTVAAKELPLAWALRAGGLYLETLLLITARPAAWAVLLGGIAAAGALVAARRGAGAGLFVVGGAVAGANVVFILLAGGDWMPNGRFVAHALPWWFLLAAAAAGHAADAAARAGRRRVVAAGALAGWLLAALLVARGSLLLDTSSWHNFTRYFWYYRKFEGERDLGGAVGALRDAATNLARGRVVGVRAFAHVHPFGPRRHGGPSGGGCLAPEMLLAVAPGAQLLVSDIGMPGYVLDDVVIVDTNGLVTPIYADYHQQRLAGPEAEGAARSRVFAHLDAAPPEWIYLYERHDGIDGTPGESVVRRWMEVRPRYRLVHVHRHWYWPDPTWTMELWRRDDVLPPDPSLLRPRMERLERLLGARHDAGATLAAWRAAMEDGRPPAWPASFSTALYGDPVARTISPEALAPARLAAEAAAR